MSIFEQSRRKRLRGAASLLVFFLLSACEVGPDFLRPAKPDVDGYTPEALAAQTAATDIRGGAAQHFMQDMDIPGQWWTLFHSETLNSYVEQALKANPSLQAAQATLRQAQENLYAGQGAFYPTVSGQVSATREKSSAIAFGLPGFSSIFSVNTAQLNVAYAPDVFGGVRRQVEGLSAQLEYQQFQLEATYLSLTANVVATAVQEASLRAQISATQDIIKLESEQLQVLQRQFDLGGASKVAVLSQAATLAQAKATLPPLQKQLAQTRNQLSNFLGRFPSQDSGENFDLATLELPQELPLSLPSKLVEQRPDVRAAEASLHAASAQIGVATANQLPSFSITGSLGTTSGSIGDMFSPGTGIWSIGGSVAQKLFDAGTLEHQKRATIAAFDASAAQYRSTVLASFQNVADALRALQSDADGLDAQFAAERAASDSLNIVRSQFQLGAVNYLSLLTAEQTYQQAHISLVQVQGNRFADTAALFQALGGGWWNRADVAPKSDTGSFSLIP